MTHSSIDVIPAATTFTLLGGPIGILIIHGYGGTIADYREIAARFHQAGYTVMGIRLPGHGQTREALRAATVQDFQSAVDAGVAELHRTCPDIFLLGSSFGGSLALAQAAKHLGAVRGVIAVNTPLSYRRGGRWQTTALRLLRLVTPYYAKPGLTAAEYEQYRELGSMTHWPINGILATRRFLGRTLRPLLPHLQVPVLMLHNVDDPYVHPDDTKTIKRLIGSNDVAIVTIPGTTHRPFRDPASISFMFTAILAFIKRIAGNA